MHRRPFEGRHLVGIIFTITMIWKFSPYRDSLIELSVFLYEN